MGNTGLTHLDAITCELVNTRDIDHLVPDLEKDEVKGRPMARSGRHLHPKL